MDRSIVIEGLGAVGEVPTQITEDDPPEHLNHNDLENRIKQEVTGDAITQSETTKINKNQQQPGSNLILVENKMYLSEEQPFSEGGDEQLLDTDQQLGTGDCEQSPHEADLNQHEHNLTNQDQDIDPHDHNLTNQELDTEVMTLDSNTLPEDITVGSGGQEVIRLLLQTEEGVWFPIYI